MKQRKSATWGVVCVVLVLSLIMASCAAAVTTTVPTTLTATATVTSTTTAIPTVSTPAYPIKNIEMNYPGAVGLGPDVTGRALASVFQSEGLIKNVQIINTNENQGASTAIGVEKFVTTVTDDPYKLMCLPRIMLMNSVMGATPYGWKDMKPIARLVTTYSSIVVPANSRFKTLADLVAALKADPRSVSVIGMAPPATDWNAFANLLLAAGVPIDKVDYAAGNSVGDWISALLGGHADVAPMGPDDAKGQVAAGALRFLGVSSPQRLPQFPDVPTFSEALGKEVTFYNWRAIFGPKNMPDYAVNWWIDALTKMDKTQAWKDQCAKLVCYPSLLTGDAFSAFLQKDNTDAWTLLKTVGLIK